jgi:hypothetical protein
MQTITPIADAKLTDPVPSAPPTPATTLQDVLQEFEQWRATKSNPGEPIPDPLWRNIFTLANTISPAKLRAIFGMSNAQYQRKFHELTPDANGALAQSPPASPPPLAFCEAKVRQPFYQPQKLPSTPTMVVEFCRADGQLMKIHTTTDSFKALLSLFFAEDFHAANHS